MCSNTLYESNMDAGSSSSGCQPQPWCNDIILNPHWWPRFPTSEPSSLSISVKGCYCMLMNSISMCSNKFYTSNMDAGSSLTWLSASTITLWHHNHNMTQNRKFRAKLCGYNCVRLLLYTNEQQTNVLKHFLCLIWMQEAVWGGCQPQPWCNDIILTPHKWPRTPRSEPSRVGINVEGS